MPVAAEAAEAHMQAVTDYRPTIGASLVNTVYKVPGHTDALCLNSPVGHTTAKHAMAGHTDIYYGYRGTKCLHPFICIADGRWLAVGSTWHAACKPGTPDAAGPGKRSWVGQGQQLGLVLAIVAELLQPPCG